MFFKDRARVSGYASDLESAKATAAAKYRQADVLRARARDRPLRMSVRTRRKLAAESSNQVHDRCDFAVRLAPLPQAVRRDRGTAPR